MPFRVYRFIDFEVFWSSTVPFTAHKHSHSHLLLLKLVPIVSSPMACSILALKILLGQNTSMILIRHGVEGSKSAVIDLLRCVVV